MGWGGGGSDGGARVTRRAEGGVGNVGAHTRGEWRGAARGTRAGLGLKPWERARGYAEARGVSVWGRARGGLVTRQDERAHRWVPY